jgi:hypothetical protein
LLLERAQRRLLQLQRTVKVLQTDQFPEFKRSEPARSSTERCV